MDTSIIQIPLYYIQFVWSQKCQKSYIPYLYDTDTCKVDNWFCPFAVHINEVWLYLPIMWNIEILKYTKIICRYKINLSHR